MSFLAAELPSNNSGGPSVHFERVGDGIVAQFVERKTGIKTTTSDDSSVTVAYVVNTNIPGINKGANASIWEGRHVKQLLGDANLAPGEGFVLRFVEAVKGKGRFPFKKFGFMRLSPEDMDTEAREAVVDLWDDAVPF